MGNWLSRRPNDNSPSGLLFVTNDVQSDLLQWGHASLFSGHPCVIKTLICIQTWFWLPSTQEDVRAFVSVCSVCTHHISLDFLNHKVTQSFWWWWLGSWRHAILYHFLRSPQKVKWLTSWCSISSGSKDFPRTWSLTEVAVHFSVFEGVWPHYCSIHQFIFWVPPQYNGQIERINLDIEKSLKSLLSKNLITTSYTTHPWACPHLNIKLVFPHLCFPNRIWSRGAFEPGGERVQP